MSGENNTITETQKVSASVTSVVPDQDHATVEFAARGDKFLSQAVEEAYIGVECGDGYPFGLLLFIRTIL